MGLKTYFDDTVDTEWENTDETIFRESSSSSSESSSSSSESSSSSSESSSSSSSESSSSSSSSESSSSSSSSESSSSSSSSESSSSSSSSESSSSSSSSESSSSSSSSSESSSSSSSSESSSSSSSSESSSSSSSESSSSSSSSESSSSSSSESSSSSSSVPSGTVYWGHDTGVQEDNVRDFTGNWAGTGNITGAGDEELLTITVTESEESETWKLGSGTAKIMLDKYRTGSGPTPTIEYKTGNSKTTCESDDWNVIAKDAGFTSQGWVKVRVSR